MSSFTNAYKSREHWGRSQLGFRRRLGSLEKHDQYKKRAKNYHQKQDKLKSLRKKAENKNPHEFNLHMIEGRQKDGIHQIGNKPEDGVIPADRLLIMKTQDTNYLTSKSQIEKKKIETLRSELHFIGLEPRNKHTIFVDDEKEAKKFDVVKHFQTHPAFADRAFNRPKLDQLESGQIVPPVKSKDVAKIDKARLRRYKELGQRIARVGQIEAARDEMQLHRQLMGKGKRKLISKRKGHKLPVYKWAPQRKK